MSNSFCLSFAANGYHYFPNYFLIAGASKLIVTPPGSPKYMRFGDTLGVTCSPDSTADAQELKWYGPNNYFPSAGEPNLIKTRTEMPVESGEAYSRSVNADF